MTPPDAVALELERLRSTCEKGFAEVKGSVALLVQRSDRTEKDLDELESRVTSLEKGRWPLPAVTAVCAVAATVISLVSLSR
ncbi:hypothetical protein [Streptomyces sp. YIM S03343]